MAEAKKYEIEVRVETQYLSDQSEPETGRHLFSYTTTVINTGTVAAQLISRHWVITDAEEQVQEVRGLGVVGHQPLLKPGQEFEYTSWTRLDTPSGTMQGTFFCMTEEAQAFQAPVGEFALTPASALH